jgi:hypothetical protein
MTARWIVVHSASRATHASSKRHCAVIFRRHPLLHTHNARRRNEMDIVGFVMIGSVVLYMLQQFERQEW